MPKEISQAFARRARLSSKAIVTAIALTLAALAAIAAASHRDLRAFSDEDHPVARFSDSMGSALIPVADR